MKIKTKRRICLAVACIGFAGILGAAGAVELYPDSVTLGETITRSLIGLAMFAGGLHKGGYLK